jgi:hypothetical protein
MTHLPLVSNKICVTLYTGRPFNNFSGALKSAGNFSSYVTEKGQVSSVEIRSNVIAEVSRCTRSVNSKEKFAPALN